MPRVITTSAGQIEAYVIEPSAEDRSPMTVLALHGGMGGHDQGLLLAQAALPDWRRHRIVAPSRPGYFGTPLAGGESPEAQADRHAALLDALGIDRVLVLAISAGGPGALHFAQRHAHRCAALALISACTDRLEPPARMRERLPRLARVARFPWLFAPLRWRAKFMPGAAAQRAIRDAQVRRATLADPMAGPLLREFLVGSLTQLHHRVSGTVNDMKQCAGLLPIALDRLTLPVLLLHGTDDDVVPYAQGVHVAEHAPSADLVPLTGGGHVALFTHVRVVRVALWGLLERVDG